MAIGILYNPHHNYARAYLAHIRERFIYRPMNITPSSARRIGRLLISGKCELHKCNRHSLITHKGFGK